MKKYSLTATLVFCYCLLSAQIQKNIFPSIKIGDKVPEITINKSLNSKITSAKISDYRGKLLILDFWATWCSPCVAMIPKMDSLQNFFEGKVQFLPVAYQNAPEIDAFRKKRKMQQQIPEVVGDTVLVNLFPHMTLPHYVWIDQEGVVCQITDTLPINKDSIALQLVKQKMKFRQKDDAALIPLDFSKPLLVNRNGGDGAGFIYHSLFTNYVPGLQSRHHFEIKDSSSLETSAITCTNMCLQLLYRLAYSDGKHHFGENVTVMNVKEPEKVFTNTLHGIDFGKWMARGNGFCYEVRVPAKLSGKMFNIMREDLDRIFPQYKVHIEERNSKCLALVRTSTADKVMTQGGDYQIDFDEAGCTVKNVNMSVFTGRLNQVFLVNSPVPVVDHTNFKHKIDLVIEANLTNVDSINQALIQYDLKLVEMELPVDKLIIQDKI